jgi:hypothetical protein
VFWGSHGCGLEHGHGNQDLHCCGSASDGVCSVVEWRQDEHTGLWVWDQTFEGGGTRYPTAVFGDDVPADKVPAQGAVDIVRAARQSAGLLPVLVDGKWVRAGNGEAWTD